jgi:hypothetical protein
MAETRTKPTSWDSLVCPTQLLDPTYIIVNSETSLLGYKEDSPLDSMEPLSTASKISAQSNIVQNFVIPVQCWVHKTNRAFANSSSFLIELEANVSEG